MHGGGPCGVGLVAEQEHGSIRVRARKGVVIGTGGFEWNEALVKTFLRGPMTGPMSVPECEGDGLLMAMEVGASLGDMSTAYWMTSTKESKAGHRDAKPNFLACALGVPARSSSTGAATGSSTKR